MIFKPQTAHAWKTYTAVAIVALATDTPMGDERYLELKRAVVEEMAKMANDK